MDRLVGVKGKCIEDNYKEYVKCEGQPHVVYYSSEFSVIVNVTAELKSIVGNILAASIKFKSKDGDKEIETLDIIDDICVEEETGEAMCGFLDYELAYQYLQDVSSLTNIVSPVGLCSTLKYLQSGVNEYNWINDTIHHLIQSINPDEEFFTRFLNAVFVYVLKCIDCDDGKHHTNAILARELMYSVLRLSDLENLSNVCFYEQIEHVLSDKGFEESINYIDIEEESFVDITKMVVEVCKAVYLVLIE